jgi:hypothetical protein
MPGQVADAADECATDAVSTPAATFGDPAQLLDIDD